MPRLAFRAGRSRQRPPLSSQHQPQPCSVAPGPPTASSRGMSIRPPLDPHRPSRPGAYGDLNDRASTARASSPRWTRSRTRTLVNGWSRTCRRIRTSSTASWPRTERHQRRLRAAVGRFKTAPRSRRDIRFAWSGDTAGQGGASMMRHGDHLPHAKHAPDFSSTPATRSMPMRKRTVRSKNTTLIDAKRKVAESLRNSATGGSAT